jgi:5-methylcytosine-specific restriction endonuclease McrA
MSKTKERIPVNLRRMVIERDGLRCVYCGVDLDKSEVHLDHVVPESQGGATSYANLQVTCRKCNTEKGVLTESQFETKLRNRAINILNRIGYK